MKNFGRLWLPAVLPCIAFAVAGCAGGNAVSPPVVDSPRTHVLAVGGGSAGTMDYSGVQDALNFSKVILDGVEDYQVLDLDVLNNPPTLQPILDGLKRLERNASSRDTVIVFLAGHGMMDKDGRYYFLVPWAGNRSLPDRIGFCEIMSAIQRIAGTVLLFVDTNYAARIADCRAEPAGGRAKQNLVMFFSSADARSMYSAGSKSGVFTLAVVEGLNGKAGANSSGQLTYRMLDAYVARRVKELTEGQQLTVTVSDAPDFPIEFIPAGLTLDLRAGRAAIHRRHYAEAIRLYSRALDSGELSSGQRTVALAYRGLAWTEQKNLDRAISDFSEAIQLNPRDARFYSGRAVVWAEKKNFDRAISNYSEAIRLNPQHALAFNNRGDAWEAKKDYDRAISDYSEAIRLDPKNEHVFNSRCWLRAIRGALKEALADCNESLRLRPSYSYSLGNRGLVHLKLRNYTAALADYEASHKANPKNTFALYGRGLAKHLNGDIPGGEADLAAAMKADPKIAEKYKGYGVPGLAGAK